MFAPRGEVMIQDPGFNQAAFCFWTLIAPIPEATQTLVYSSS